MIEGLHHIAIICSSESSLDFYRALGFEVVSTLKRPEKNDEIVMMDGYGIRLEVFVTAEHPKRPSNPEANGLRHLALKVTDIEKVVESLNKYEVEPIRVSPISGLKMTFAKDPDGLPIELNE